MNRGSVKAKASEMVALWVPLDLLNVLDEAVREEDSDRSKFIRNAIRDKLARVEAQEAA